MTYVAREITTIFDVMLIFVFITLSVVIVADRFLLKRFNEDCLSKRGSVQEWCGDASVDDGPIVRQDGIASSGPTRDRG